MEWPSTIEIPRPLSIRRWYTAYLRLVKSLSLIYYCDGWVMEMWLIGELIWKVDCIRKSEWWFVIPNWISIWRLSNDPVWSRKYTCNTKGVTYTFLINTWNTLLESYQHKVDNNTLATIKRQIQQAENPMPAEVISKEAAHVDNAIRLDYLTSEVALEEPEIESTDHRQTKLYKWRPAFQEARW